MAEKEYIERDSLVGKLIEMKYCSTSSKIDFGDVIRLINSEPTADVQEVRHGKWDEELYDIICSACKESFNIMDNDAYRFDFCPHCGAKMDKE